MKRSSIYLLTLLMMVISLSASVYAQQGIRPRGDVNCDWELSIADFNVMIDSILTDARYHPFYSYSADVNGDHEFTIADFNAVVSAILGDTIPPMPSYSGTLPVLFINTEGHQNIVSKEDYLHADWWLDNMGIEDFQSIGSAWQPLGMLIKGHGNYTWNHYDKKSFRIKLDEKQPLMGMDSNKHFCLLGHADDKLAKLKNSMGFELSRRIGLAYTPADEPVEVVLNGEYIGLYFLTEKIRVGKNRVNIEEQMDTETDSDKITCGWLLEFDNSPKEGEYVWINEFPNDYDWHHRIYVAHHSPEILTSEQELWLKQYLSAVNTAIYSDDKTSTEWEKYIDIDTLAMYYIVGEIMDDLEYFAGSCYMYRHSGDSTKLIFGPVWDFGNSFQRWAIYKDSLFNKFIYEQPTKFSSHWIAEIAKYPHFQEVVKLQWNKFYQSGFNGLDIDAFIDDYVDHIAPAFYAEIKRWPQHDIYKKKSLFKFFIHQKINWLNKQWGDGYQ